jgi:PIN domain nuclease of toxin-antitoxin system
LGQPVETWLSAALRPEITSLLPLSPSIAVESCQLPGSFHADPADRLIVATARLHGLTLISADESIRAYPHLLTLWD